MLTQREARMSSKARVMAVFAGEVPDRVPINYAANAGIHSRLEAYFGTQDVAGALGVDFAGVHPRYTGPRLHPERPERRVNAEWGSHTRWVAHPSGGYWDFCDFPLKGASLEAMEAWPMPSPDHYAYSTIEAQCRQRRSLAVHCGGAGLGDVINSTGFLCGMEDVLVRLAEEDPGILRLIDRKLEVQLEVTRRTLEAGRGGFDFLWMGEDLGSQRGPLVSRPFYKKFLRPRHQRFVDLARAFNLPVMIHSCGSSSWAFPEFIEMGIRGVDTLQPEAKDMAPERLKQDFGGRLIFHGCISTAGPVAHGSVADTVACVRRTLEIMRPGGGYCFAPAHQLQDNSPTENVVAMYETAHRYGWFE